MYLSGLGSLLAQVGKVGVLFPELVSLNLDRLPGGVLPLTWRCGAIVALRAPNQEGSPNSHMSAT